MFVAQALKDALRCVTLFFDQGFVCAQYLVNDTNITVKRWTVWRLCTPVTRWQRVTQHLRYCLAVLVEMPRCFARRHPILQTRVAHAIIDIHRIHLPSSE